MMLSCRNVASLFAAVVLLSSSGSARASPAPTIRLTPLADGTVRQLIEYSQDGGDTWQPLFDAICVRSETRSGGTEVR